jgi:hypothetical protein
MKGSGIGRGGNREHYTWALLDWSNETSGHRRRAYLAMNGDPQQIVCRNMWINWLSQNSNNNLRRLVAAFPDARGSEIIPEELRELSQHIEPLH